VLGSWVCVWGGGLPVGLDYSPFALCHNGPDKRLASVNPSSDGGHM
jgi:hypothetical protein